MEQATTTTGRRLPNLDVLRGLAAMAVLVGHAYGLGGSKVPLSSESLTDTLLMLSPIGVWLFFAMSGLVIGRPYVRALVSGEPRPGMVGYAIRRIARIYPLYLVCAAVVLLTVARGHIGPKTSALHLLLLHNLVPERQLAFINVTWTLTLEVLFYASVPILAGAIGLVTRKPITPRRLARWIVLSAAASVAWMLLGAMVADSQPSVSLWLRMLYPAMWSAFCPGLLIAVLHESTPTDIESSAILRFVHRLRTDADFGWALGLGFAALGVASFFAQPEWGNTPFLWIYDLGRVAWSAAFGVLVLRAADAHHIAARTPAALESLGTWSYGIYLIHGTVFTILMEHNAGDLIPMQRGGFIPFLVHVAVLTAITIPLSWLAWHLIERPAIKAAQTLTRRTALAPA